MQNNLSDLTIKYKQCVQRLKEIPDKIKELQNVDIDLDDYFGNSSQTNDQMQSMSVKVAQYQSELNLINTKIIPALKLQIKQAVIEKQLEITETMEMERKELESELEKKQQEFQSLVDHAVIVGSEIHGNANFLDGLFERAISKTRRNPGMADVSHSLTFNLGNIANRLASQSSEKRILSEYLDSELMTIFLGNGIEIKTEKKATDSNTEKKIKAEEKDCGYDPLDSNHSYADRLKESFNIN